MTVAGGGAVLGGGPGAAQQEPVQLQRAGDAQGDVYYCGHGQLPGRYCRYSIDTIDTLDTLHKY